MPRKKRNTLEIIKEILGVILLNRNISPTKLLYKANLSPQMLKDRVNDLIGKGLMSRIIVLKGEIYNGKKSKAERKYLNLTELGRQYLEDYKAVEIFLEKYELNEEE